jgi:hypothetical protein
MLRHFSSGPGRSARFPKMFPHDCVYIEPGDALCLRGAVEPPRISQEDAL